MCPVPPHLYGELAKCETGIKFLKEINVLNFTVGFCTSILKTPFLKTIMFSLCSVVAEDSQA
jgi:hypothetical protein